MVTPENYQHKIPLSQWEIAQAIADYASLHGWSATKEDVTFKVQEGQMGQRLITAELKCRPSERTPGQLGNER